jgi:hypothetical protein
MTQPEVSVGTLSPDDGFFWDGAQWVPALSSGGYWTWNGAGWVPAESLSGPGSFHPYISSGDLLIRLWWAAWLVSLVLFNVAAFSGVDTGIVSWQGALSAQAAVLAAVLAILVVRSVSARQDERWGNLRTERNRERR